MFQLKVVKSPALLGFLAFTLLALSACDGNRQYVLKRLPAGDNRWITISADEMAEISTGVYYEVKIGQEIVRPKRLICFSATDPDSLSFKTLSAAGGNLIGVYEESQPEKILALHDFGKGATWPGGSPDKSDWENNTAGGKLLEELQQEFPDRNLKLNGDACGIKSSSNR
jgi:hypothetical protein